MPRTLEENDGYGGTRTDATKTVHSASGIAPTRTRHHIETAMDFESEGQTAGRRIGYLRVSTAEQRPDRQIDGLTDLCDELRIEVLSAVKDVRPIFDALLKELRAGDTLVVWDLDRAFRSTRDALAVSETLEHRGIALDVVRMRMDTSRPEGMLMYTIMAAVGEFERQTLARRTREGLEAARRRGVRLGRPPKLTDAELAAIAEDLGRGFTLKALAERHGVAPWTLTRALRRAKARSQERSPPRHGESAN